MKKEVRKDNEMTDVEEEYAPKYQVKSGVKGGKTVNPNAMAGYKPTPMPKPTK